MQRPKIVTSIYDYKEDITYKVVAYRKLTHDEAVRTVQNALSTQKIKKPGKGKTLSIELLAGYEDDDCL